MLRRIAKHIAKNSISINEQHGIRNKLSTFTRLIHTNNDWANALSIKVQSDTMYFLNYVKHLIKYHIHFLYSSVTTMRLEITHLAG